MHSDADIIDESPPARRTLPNEAIALLLIVAVAGGGLFYMHRRAAAPESAAPAAEADLNQFLATGPASLQAISAKITRTQRLLAQFDTFAQAQQVAYSDFASDPFTPRCESPAPPTAADTSQHDAREQAGELRLQSIIHSSSRRACLIDGRLYREHQIVDGFTIESIRAESVIVQKGRYRFELPVGR